MRLTAAAIGTWAVISMVACSGDSTGPGDEDPFGPAPGQAACTSTPPLTQLPVPLSWIRQIAPLGSMSGGGHLFPATHLGLFPVSNTGSAVPLAAPGDLIIRQVARTTYTGAGAPPADYAIHFFPCADLRMHFGHVTAIDPAILTQLGAWTASDCVEPYAIGSTTIEACTKNVAIEVAAGTALGTQAYTMDWGAVDRRQHLAYVNPERFGGNEQEFGQNSAVCAVDYLQPAVRASVHDLFGSGGVQRTAEPVCGTVMHDIPGTAQGRWFINDDWNERLHLALVRDQIDPGIAAFSVGTSIPSLPTNLYRFDPATTGRINLDFPRVGADGLIYCYEPTSLAPDRHRIFIQLLSNTRLRIEGSPGSSCGDPASWAFSAGAVEFVR